jgi:hypothetical protein
VLLEVFPVDLFMLFGFHILYNVLYEGLSRGVIISFAIDLKFFLLSGRTAIRPVCF